MNTHLNWSNNLRVFHGLQDPFPLLRLVIQKLETTVKQCVVHVVPTFCLDAHEHTEVGRMISKPGKWDHECSASLYACLDIARACAV